MGIQCDLFVADPADAPRYERGFHAAKLKRAQLGGLTQLPFEVLWAILEGRPWNPATHALESIGEPQGDDESWFIRVPPALVTRLAGPDGPEIATVTAEWAQTEELGCYAEEITDVVSSLLALARHAVTSGRGLYLWGST